MADSAGQITGYAINLARCDCCETLPNTREEISKESLRRTRSPFELLHSQALPNLKSLPTSSITRLAGTSHLTQAQHLQKSSEQNQIEPHKLVPNANMRSTSAISAPDDMSSIPSTRSPIMKAKQQYNADATHHDIRSGQQVSHDNSRMSQVAPSGSKQVKFSSPGSTLTRSSHQSIGSEAFSQSSYLSDKPVGKTITEAIPSTHHHSGRKNGWRKGVLEHIITKDNASTEAPFPPYVLWVGQVPRSAKTTRNSAPNTWVQVYDDRFDGYWDDGFQVPPHAGGRELIEKRSEFASWRGRMCRKDADQRPPLLLDLPHEARQNIYNYVVSTFPMDLHFWINRTVIAPDEETFTKDYSIVAKSSGHVAGDFKLLRSITRTIGNERTWVLHTSNLHCRECIDTLFKQSREVITHFQKYVLSD